jgi:monofunctional biosynthetic peptidoglycan transglycosylase
VKAARARNRRHPKRRPLGASTITQQLAKNLFLSPERSWTRKGREAAIALTMELVLPKRTILEHYLSGIEWGERTWGCEAAARKYFGTSAASLTRSQSAWLAAMIPGPRLFLRNPSRHDRRAARILSRMSRAGDFRPLLLDEADDGVAR